MNEETSCINKHSNHPPPNTSQRIPLPVSSRIASLFTNRIPHK